MWRFVPLALVCACSPFPDVDDRVSDAAREAPFPTLLPLDQINAQADGVSIDAAVPAAVAARVARIEARAAILRGAPVDDTTRARLAALGDG